MLHVGDSGSGLVTFDSRSKRFHLVGLTQSGVGDDCGLVGIYIRIDDPLILNFIKETTKGNLFVLLSGKGQLQLMNLHGKDKYLDISCLKGIKSARSLFSRLPTVFQYEESFSGFIPNLGLFTCGGFMKNSHDPKQRSNDCAFVHGKNVIKSAMLKERTSFSRVILKNTVFLLG